MIATTRAIAEAARAGAPVGVDLRASLTHMGDALRVHNLQEEALLGGLIVSVDAWGSARAEIMSDEHVREHARIQGALRGISHTPVEFAGGGICALLDAMIEHMDREETAFLGEDVLRDDITVPDQSAG